MKRNEGLFLTVCKKKVKNNFDLFCLYENKFVSLQPEKKKYDTAHIKQRFDY